MEWDLFSNKTFFLSFGLTIIYVIISFCCCCKYIKYLYIVYTLFNCWLLAYIIIFFVVHKKKVLKSKIASFFFVLKKFEGCLIFLYFRFQFQLSQKKKIKRELLILHNLLVYKRKDKTVLYTAKRVVLYLTVYLTFGIKRVLFIILDFTDFTPLEGIGHQEIADSIPL